MKILHLTINPNGGGAERVASLICKNLALEGIESRVIGIDPLQDNEIKSDVDSLNTKRYRKIHRELSAAIRLRKILKEENFSHLHIHCEAPELVSALATFRLKKIRIIVSEHTERPWVKYRAVGFLVRKNLNKKDAIFVNCANFKNRWMQNDKPRYIQNYTRDDVNQFEIPQNRDTIKRIFLSQRLIKSKRVSEVLSAIKSSESNFQIEIFGDGPEREYLEELSKVLELDVNFHGFKENPWKHFERGDLVISASDYEGNPMTICEALVINAPVLLRNIPSHAFAISNPLQGFDDFDELSFRLKEVSKGVFDSSCFQTDILARHEILVNRMPQGINSAWKEVYCEGSVSRD